MKVTRNRLRLLLLEEAGQDLIEYALLAALIALAAFVSMHKFGKKLSNDYTRLGKKM